MVLIDEPHWEDVLKELSNVVPREIHLTDFKMEKGVIYIEGVVSSSDGENILSQFIMSLEEGIFKNVKLVKTRDLKDKTGNQFEIECWVD